MLQTSRLNRSGRKAISLTLTLMFVSLGLPAFAPGSARVGPKSARDAQKPQLLSPVPIGSAYRQTNLVSDLPGVAFLQDPLLVNPWGISMTPTSAFWVANNRTSSSTLYLGDVGGAPLVKNSPFAGITIPSDLPTGIVWNPNAPTSGFVITSGSASGPAIFLFATLNGRIWGWNPNVPTNGSTVAVVAATQAGHVYTGLALANNGSGDFIYAADFANGNIDVFNDSFALQAPASFPFTDPTIPTAPGNVYHPYNIQAIGGSLYVAYAKVGTGGLPEDGVGNGFVRRFTANGVRDDRRLGCPGGRCAQGRGCGGDAGPQTVRRGHDRHAVAPCGSQDVVLCGEHGRAAAR